MGIRQRILPITLLAATSIPLHAQSESIGIAQPQPPARPTQPKGTITGTVLCSDTRRPARGAMVIIGPLPTGDGKPETNQFSTMTHVAMDGTFTAPNLEPGDYGVIVVLPGYLSAMDDFSSVIDQDPKRVREAIAGNIVTLSAGGHSTFDVTLQRGAAISGRILYSDGSPASQINIDVEDTPAKAASDKTAQENQARITVVRQMLTHQTTFTDDQGHYRISGLKPGTYRIAAIQTAPSTDDSRMYPLSEVSAAANPADLYIYAGNTLHKSAAKTFELRTSDELAGIDITIPLDIFHRVHGTLSAKDGRPVTSSTLTLTDTADDSFKFSINVNEDGTFTFPTVPSGTYTLAASTPSIIVPAHDNPPGTPLRYGPHKTTAAFADATIPILVKDSNLDDVTFTLTEVPIPPDANKPATPDQDPDPPNQ